MLRTMTARELGQWETYARRFRLPQQRIELMLANIARMSAGATDLADFVFDPRMRDALRPRVEEKMNPEAAANAVGAIFGGVRVVHLGAVPMGQERKASNG